jgi:hypothetical protein
MECMVCVVELLAHMRWWVPDASTPVFVECNWRVRLGIRQRATVVQSKRVHGRCKPCCAFDHVVGVVIVRTTPARMVGMVVVVGVQLL